MLATPELIERLKAASGHAQRRESGGVATDAGAARVIVSLQLTPLGVEVMATGVFDGDRIGPTIRELVAWPSITNARVCPLRAVTDATITEAMHKGALSHGRTDTAEIDAGNTGEAGSLDDGLSS